MIQAQTLEELDREIPATLMQGLGTFDIPKTSIKLDDWKLRELWCKGIINDLSYITFALELESKATFNIDSFARKWENIELSEEQLNDGWKSKKLKIRTVLNVIGILDEKGLGCCDFNVKVSQLSLFE
jgi:hypothetical protein